MTRDEIARMAREQGLPETEVEGVFRVNSDDLGRMLAAEREKVARWMRERGYATGHGDTTEDLLGELRTQEREACLDCIRPNATPMEIAAAIRARGNK